MMHEVRISLIVGKNAGRSKARQGTQPGCRDRLGGTHPTAECASIVGAPAITLDAFLVSIWPFMWAFWLIQEALGSHSPITIVVPVLMFVAPVQERLAHYWY